MIQAINGGKHVHGWKQNTSHKKLTIRENAQPFRINLDGEYGGWPSWIGSLHNHLEFFANIDEINNDALVHLSEE